MTEEERCRREDADRRAFWLEMQLQKAESRAAELCADLLGIRVSKIGKTSKFLVGSFSAVSKRNFARKYAFDSILQALQELYSFAPLQSQNFRKKSV